MFKNKERIVFLAPLSALSRRLRLLKIANYIHESFPDLSIGHVGWERARGEREEDSLSFPVDKKIIMTGGGYGGGRVKYLYFIWVIKSFFHCLTLKKTDVVWALGFESAFPALLASKIKRFSVVFDDADRFSLVFAFPKLVSQVIQYFERLTSRRVTLHLIPGIERYDFTSNKFRVLKNMPSEIEINRAKIIFKKTQWTNAGVVININGWLHETRGIDVALELSKRLADDDIHFLVAGGLASEEAQTLIQQRNVTYLGRVSNSEALASYFASDFVLTYFKPTTVINTLAESNKWGDAIKCGIGVIVNHEVKTAEYLRQGGACISFYYHDVDSLEREIRQFISHKYKLIKVKDNSQKLSTKYGFFEDQLREILGN